MTLPSPSAPPLITANLGINLITHSSPRGWGSEAPGGITRCLRLLGRIRTSSLGARPFPSVSCPPAPPPQGPPLILSCSVPRVTRCPAPWVLAGCRGWFGQLSVWPGSGVAEEASPGLAGGASNADKLQEWEGWRVGAGVLERPPDRSWEKGPEGGWLSPLSGLPSQPPFCLSWIKSFSDVSGWVCNVKVQ